MTDKNITGRDGYIMSKALAYAIAFIQSLPEEDREDGDVLDMCCIARERYEADLLIHAATVEGQTGLTLNLWPELEAETGANTLLDRITGRHS